VSLVVQRLTLSLDSSPLPLWVLASVLAYAAGTSLVWRVSSRGAARRPYDQWLVEVARFLFYLGIPYLALGGWPRRPYQGLLAPEDMGLVGPGSAWPANRWLEAVGTGFGLALLALIVLLVAWNQAHQIGLGRGLGFSPRAWWLLLVEGLYLEAHWAFYRSALAVTLGDLYAGVFWGLGVVFVEWACNPLWREGWRQPAESAALWLRAALALLSALLFLLTRNLWVCLGVHWLLTAVLWLPGRHQVPDKAQSA
jgi:hypothetical protein